VLIATLGWRSIFFINVPIGLVGLWLTITFAHETPRSVHRGLDIPGQLTAVFALSALAATLIEAGPLGVADPRVLAGFGVFAIAGVLFLVAETRTASPMLPLRLFRERMFAPTLIGLLVNLCFYGLIFLFSLLLQSEHRFSALQTGLAFLPMTAAIVAANLLGGLVIARIGSSRTVLVGTLAMLVGCAGLLPTVASTTYPALLVQQLLLGAGLGLLVPPLTGSLLRGVDRARSGVASATLTTMRQIGSLLGIALFGSLIATPSRFFAGFHAALAISIVALAASAALAPRLATRPGSRRRRGLRVPLCARDPAARWPPGLAGEWSSTPRASPDAE
jgi:DHA2 family methylenomycin A resistance protein-like MFS transporter